MIDFALGVSSVGQLHPSPADYSNYPTIYSEWNGVAMAFFQVGNNLYLALNEFKNAQRKDKPTT